MAKTRAEQNKELIREYFTAWDAGDPDAVTQFFRLMSRRCTLIGQGRTSMETLQRFLLESSAG